MDQRIITYTAYDTAVANYELALQHLRAARAILAAAEQHASEAEDALVANERKPGIPA